MEVLSLSLSRLQVLCHSLSKVLFKLSLTLLVRYRSSYSVFNFGRHIPAAWHFTPKKCYSLSTHSVALGFLAQWANTFYGSILTRRVVFSRGFALHIEFRQSRTNHDTTLVPQLNVYITRFGIEFDPSSLAADWRNHGCFLFLRWVICLSLAGNPAALRSVTNNGRGIGEKKLKIYPFLSLT